MSYCEDFPCCGHEAGDCPDSEGRFKCVGCGALLPRNNPDSFCAECHRNQVWLDPEDRDWFPDEDEDDEEYEEEEYEENP